MISTFILWDFSPVIYETGSLALGNFQIGPFALRWYGLFFALGFIIGQQIMAKIYALENKDQSQLETLTIYMVLATIIGARLGHCLFYEPEWYLAHPLEILKVWEGGLASHGATLGIFISIYLYTRKFKTESFLWILDRMVIVIALAGCFIRFGNLMNSEIIGKQTDKSWALVFAQPTVETLQETYPEYIHTASLHYVKQDDTLYNGKKYAKVDLVVNLNTGLHADTVKKVKFAVIPSFVEGFNFKEKNLGILPATIPVEEYKDGAVQLTYQAIGVPRHPSQLYESLSCIVLFVLLIFIYSRFKAATPEGLLLGTFMVVCFGLRFLYEFLKENQVDFENNLTFNLGQLLSIPLVLAGIWLIVRSLGNKKSEIK